LFVAEMCLYFGVVLSNPSALRSFEKVF